MAAERQNSLWDPEQPLSQTHGDGILSSIGRSRWSPPQPCNSPQPFDTFLTVSISFWGIFTYPPTTSWLVLSPCVILRFLRGSLNGPVDHPLLLTGSSLEVALLIYNHLWTDCPWVPYPPLVHSAVPSLVMQYRLGHICLLPQREAVGREFSSRQQSIACTMSGQHRRD